MNQDSGSNRALGGRIVRVGVVLLGLAASVGGCAATDWRAKVDQELPAMGHRNWIVIADAAYPWQSADGIETVATGAKQLDVVQAVLAAVDKTDHVRPVVYLDSEMKYVAESEAPGVSAYREQLDGILKGRSVMRIPHEELIAKLDEGAKTFRILILKTDFTVPYTSVFINLDCGYWGAAQEKKLRDAIGKAGKVAGRK